VCVCVCVCVCVKWKVGEGVVYRYYVLNITCYHNLNIIYKLYQYLYKLFILKLIIWFCLGTRKLLGCDYIEIALLFSMYNSLLFYKIIVNYFILCSKMNFCLQRLLLRNYIVFYMHHYMFCMYILYMFSTMNFIFFSRNIVSLSFNNVRS